MGHPFAKFLATSMQKKWDHPPSGSLGHHCGKRAHVDSREVKARSDHICMQGNENTLGLVPEAGPSSTQREKESASPHSRAFADPDDGTAAESSQSTGDQAS